MSSFFTTPASQRKRKRTDAPSTASKKRNVASNASQPAKTPRRTQREESISGSESSEDEREAVFSEDQDETGTSDEENETAAEKRLRLAERYLENIKQEVEDGVGFDAAEIDRDLIAERLKEDVAETKGKVYRRIADTLDFEAASHVMGKSGLQHAITGCAIHLPYAWTISKDIVLEKWELADPKKYNSNDPNQPTNITPRRTPKRLFWRKGNKNKAEDRGFVGHTGAVLSIAISDSGKILATGDEKGRLIIWDSDTLTPRRMFTHHRDAVTSLSFRRGTDQLFSGSADRQVKVWSASELAYIETLHGHQDAVVGMAGGLEINQETCVSVGSRDRLALMWKVVEEASLKFIGGGTARQKGLEKLWKGRFGKEVKDDDEMMNQTANGIGEDGDGPPIAYAEGSVDCVAWLEAGLFVTGSDNGQISLWSVNRKKSLFRLPLCHGRDPPIPPEEMSADGDVRAPRLPRYITAIATIPFADLIITASWDGWIRTWRLGPEKRTIEPLGKIGRVAPSDGETTVNDDIGNQTQNQGSGPIRGIVNGLSIRERGERGKEGLCVVAAVGKELRLGRWMKKKGPNGIVVFEVPRKRTANEGEEPES